MSTFVSVMLIWVGFLAAVIWPSFRTTAKPVRWIALLFIAAGFALSYYVWMAQRWTPPVLWIMRVMEPFAPRP